MSAAKSTSVRILIVEDDPVFSQVAEGLVRPILQAFPHSTVTLVETLEAALAAIADVPSFDVTLLDLALPPHSMEETIKHLDEFESKTAVVILTGHKEELVTRLFGKLRETPIVEKDEALRNPGLLHVAICAAVDAYQTRKWAQCRENLRVMRSICHAAQ